MKACRYVIFFLTLLWIQLTAAMQTNDYQLIKNIPYREVNGIPLHLDLYLPHHAIAQKGVIIWIHGGLWSKGSKENVRLLTLTSKGYAIASIDYRLSGTAPYPAQSDDILAAFEWLKIHGHQYHINTNTMIMAGESAGGHLAALAALSLSALQQAPSLKGIIVYYGATNLNTILAQTTYAKYSVRTEALEKLLGGTLEEKAKLAYEASPINYIDDNAPPLLIFHGVQDTQMPINQAHELVESYLEHHRPVQFHVINHANHADKQFYSAGNLKRVTDFLESIER